MNEKLKAIHEYLCLKGFLEDDLFECDQSSVYLAMEIMEYAHRNQKRVNGENYALHPSRVLQNYRNFIGLNPDKIFTIDVDLLYKNGIPFDGVQEVCILHDVIEDTEFSIKDLKQIYDDCGFKKHFELYLEDALKRITHDEAMDYEEYIKIVLQNPISAIVKMMDLQDNLRVIDLLDFNERNYKRAQEYLGWIYVINNAYHFLEKGQKYREEYKRK